MTDARVVAVAELCDAIADLRRVELIVERLVCHRPPPRELVLARALLALAKLRADDAEVECYRAIDSATAERAERFIVSELLVR